MWKPEEDGITHINIFSRGKTLLGKQLSNFHLSPFVCSYGQFSSVEGMWYWIKITGGERDIPEAEALRTLYGWKAKEVGKDLLEQYGKVWIANFNEVIKHGIECKLEQNPEISDNFFSSELPFAHYYVFNGGPKYLSEYDWIVNHFEELRG